MTPRQVRDIYFCERDDKGRPVAAETGRPVTAESAARLRLYKAGITDPARQEAIIRGDQG